MKFGNNRVPNVTSSCLVFSGKTPPERQGVGAGGGGEVCPGSEARKTSCGLCGLSRFQWATAQSWGCQGRGAGWGMRLTKTSAAKLITISGEDY